jgi:hypothetical protein
VTVGEAKRIGREWVLEHAGEVHGLQGAFFAGSVNGKSDHEELDDRSDIDLYHVVSEEQDPGVRLRTLRHAGMLLQPSYHDRRWFTDAETVLANYVYAYHFSVPSLILDPSGRLTAIHQYVSERFAEPEQAARRCERIATEARNDHLPAMKQAPHLEDRVPAFLAAANLIRQLPIAASLKPPTVRRSCMLFTEIMVRLGHRPLAESLLELLGSAGMDAGRADGLRRDCMAAYERAVEVHRNPVPWDFYLGPEAKPLVVDGTRDFFDRAFHRESLWWILYVHWFVKNALLLEVPEEYERLLDSLGIGSPEAIAKKAPLAEELLARTMAVAARQIQERSS